MSHDPPEIVDDRSFFARVLEPGRATLVLFTARDCLSCSILAHRLPALAAELRGAIDVVCCPVEASPRTVQRYTVARTPTLLLVMAGGVLASRIGPAPLPVIRHWVVDALTRHLQAIDCAPGATVSGTTEGRRPTRVLLRHLVSRPTVLRACAVASVVAPVLLLLNHAELLLSSPLSRTVLRKLALNFVVPYLVSSYSSARAASRPAAIEPRSTR